MGSKAFALRSHVNEIVGTCAVHQTTPQVPRIPMSLCPRRPTAHAQVMKSSPRPLASPKSRKNTQDLDPHMIFLMDESRVSLVTCGTCVTPEWRHAHFFALIYRMNISYLLLRGRSHERWMRPFDIMVVTCEWPRFDERQFDRGQSDWNKIEMEGWLDPRSKLNKKQSTIGTYEAVVYCPMID